MSTSQKHSAVKRVWEIPTLRDAILSYTTRTDHPKVALIDWAAFHHVINAKYGRCKLYEIERVVRACQSDERKLIYRQAVRELQLYQYHQHAKRPARWPTFLRLYPNTKLINYEDDYLYCNIGADGKREFTFRFEYHEFLPLDPKEPFQKRVGLPKNFDIKRIIELAIENQRPTFPPSHNLNGYIKTKLHERIKFYGYSPETLMIAIPMIPNQMIYEIYSDLVLEKGFNTPKYITLATSNNILPDLVNLLGKNLHDLTILAYDYDIVEISFQDFYRNVNWKQSRSLANLTLPVRRDPSSDTNVNPEDNHITDQAEDQDRNTNTRWIDVRNDIQSLPDLTKFIVGLIYPVGMELSPSQIEVEKEYVRQIADAIYPLINWDSYISKDFSGLNQVNMERFRYMNYKVSAYCRTPTGGQFAFAEFGMDLNKVFAERILEKLNQNVRSYLL